MHILRHFWSINFCQLAVSMHLCQSIFAFVHDFSCISICIRLIHDLRKGCGRGGKRNRGKGARARATEKFFGRAPINKGPSAGSSRKGQWTQAGSWGYKQSKTSHAPKGSGQGSGSKSASSSSSKGAGKSASSSSSNTLSALMI